MRGKVCVCLTAVQGCLAAAKIQSKHSPRRSAQCSRCAHHHSSATYSTLCQLFSVPTGWTDRPCAVVCTGPRDGTTHCRRSDDICKPPHRHCVCVCIIVHSQYRPTHKKSVRQQDIIIANHVTCAREFFMHLHLCICSAVSS